MFHEPNPFGTAETLTIDEGAPRRSTARANIRAIVIRASSTVSRHVDVGRVQGVMDALPNPERVRLFAVDYDSRLSRLPSLARFPQLAHLHIGARRIRDYSPIHRLRALKNVFLVGYKHRDLADMAPLRLEELRLIRGQITTLDVSASWALIQGCTQLRDLGDSSIRFLILQACNKLSCDSLRKVRGLRRVDLLGCRGATEFSWMRACKTLQRLSVTATPSSRMDLSTLRGAHARQLFLSIPAAKLREVSNMLPEAAVSNGDVWYRGGAVGEGSDPLLEDAWR